MDRPGPLLHRHGVWPTGRRPGRSTASRRAHQPAPPPVCKSKASVTSPRQWAVIQLARRRAMGRGSFRRSPAVLCVADAAFSLPPRLCEAECHPSLRLLPYWLRNTLTRRSHAVRRRYYFNPMRMIDAAALCVAAPPCSPPACGADITVHSRLRLMPPGDDGHRRAKRSPLSRSPSMPRAQSAASGMTARQRRAGDPTYSLRRKPAIPRRLTAAPLHRR